MIQERVQKQQEISVRGNIRLKEQTGNEYLRKDGEGS